MNQVLLSIESAPSESPFLVDDLDRVYIFINLNPEKTRFYVPNMRKGVQLQYIRFFVLINRNFTRTS